jgi:hypothetical protein
MSEQQQMRVRRGQPTKTYYRTTVRDAIDDLVRDFNGRCAYSMQHGNRLGGLGGLHVEHFNPNLKKEEIQAYENLFPVSHTCNTVKGKKWPSDEELRAGLRFLNCCEEIDYGEHIVENATSHELVPTSPAASFHLRWCGLKGGKTGEYFRTQRQERTKLWQILETYGVTPENADFVQVPDALVQAMINVAQELIPPIKAV